MILHKQTVLFIPSTSSWDSGNVARLGLLSSPLYSQEMLLCCWSGIPGQCSEHWELGWGGACIRQWEEVGLKHQQRGFGQTTLGRCLRKVSVQKRVDEVSKLTRIKDLHLRVCGREGLLFQLVTGVFIGFCLFPFVFISLF